MVIVSGITQVHVTIWLCDSSGTEDDSVTVATVFRSEADDTVAMGTGRDIGDSVNTGRGVVI